MITLAFVEVGDDQTQPPAYARRLGRHTSPFDYLWSTPRLDDLDPWERFRKELDLLRRKS